MVEEDTTKSVTSTAVQKAEQEATDRSTNLKLVTSSPQFMKLKEILQENQRLLKPVDSEKEKKNAGYKVLEEILNKGNNKLGI